MINKIKKNILAVTFPLLVSNLFAAENSSNKVTLEVTPTLAISTPVNPNSQATGSILKTNWTVTANNAFTYAFSGSSFNDNGENNAYPLFTKQDIDASGSLVPNSYDHLNTSFGIEITGAQSTQTSEVEWGDAGSPIQTPKNLVSITGTAPADTTGRVMPGDNTGTALISLYSTGKSSQSTQSGAYSAIVTLTVTADPQ